MSSNLNRNSLIELYRFIFAINVIKSHGMFPYEGQYFGTGKLSVEFFFVLSGYLLTRSIDKYRDLPLLSGTWKFLLSKLRPIALPLIVALPFNIIYELADWDGSFNIWGYLWYVRVMLEVFVLYFVIRRILKDERWFIAIVATVFVIASILHVIPRFYAHGMIRGTSAISLGMLLSYIPRPKIKKKCILWLALIPVQAACLGIIMLDCNLIVEEILDLILYPALIYLSFALPVHNRVMNYLGALSFGLYAFQCVPRALRELGLITNIWVIFGTIVALSLAEDLIKRIYKLRKQRGENSDLPTKEDTHASEAS